jgi:PAS domain S-box-containing protein
MTARPEGSDQTLSELRRENDELRAALGELRQRLREPEDIIRALRHGEVDAFVVTEPRGERIYSLRSADVLYRGMIENMKEGALVLDRGGVVVYCNAYFAELIEIDRAAILGTSILPSIPEESRSFFSNLQQPGRGAVARERLRGEIVLRSQSGQLVPLFATTNRLEVDEHDLICVILTDLRGQKREQELLEQSKRKDEFLAMLAHELRNPLAPIRNAASLLTVGAPNEARLQRARGVIDRQVSHLTRLIDDLLDVSRITRGKIRLDAEPIDLGLAISRSVETARPLVEAHRHHFSVELPSEQLLVHADLTRLSQALANLLNNAAKFTPDGGTITLTVRRTGSMIEVSVRDSGIGVAPDMLPRIFDLFTQVDATPGRSQGGLGIGLTLVRTLVEMHGGAGQGSEFVVRLPALSDAQEGGQAHPEEHSEEHSEAHPEGRGERGKVYESPRERPMPRADQGATRRILVVDDNIDSLQSLTEVLEQLGHEVRAAPDGETALELARQFRPQVMLVDIGLPGMNGYDLARALRRTPELEQATLVALTGYGREEDRRASLDAGFNAHWVKPIGLDVLSTVASPSLRQVRS